MRAGSLLYSACLVALLFVGCASGPSGTPGNPLAEYEIAYDDNRPSEAMNASSSTFEAMVRFKLPKGSRPLRMRALLAHAGKVRWTVYAQDALEQPGEVLASWDRDYGDDLASGPSEGKWIVENLSARIGTTTSAAIWVGFRRNDTEASLWASGLDCENAFVRDVDPHKFLRPMPIRKTPMVRVDWGKE
jgi:hypothetical protein